jgi:hypothetical protein
VRLEGVGISADLPDGWEGSIRRGHGPPSRRATAELPPAELRSSEVPAPQPDAAEFGAVTGGAATDGAATAGAGDAGAGEDDLALAHLGNFPLPPDRGDFGSGAVDVMLPRDVFVALVEYEPASADTALFARRGLPHALAATDFGRASLQRTLDGQAGTQVFFNEAGRAFCLYVVLGAAARAIRLVPAVNRVLREVRIARR